MNRLAVPVSLLLACPGCLHLGLTHRHREEPLRDAQLDALVPGTTDLGAALKALGAPLDVWEYRADGMALAWAWSHTTRFGFRMSYSVAPRTPAASFSWDDATLDQPGCVLWFGPDLVLESAKRGKLRDLTASLRRRPSAQEYD